jgi:hypothetical protein
MGQKRTLEAQTSMSALPPKADIGTQPRNVRFVPLPTKVQRSKMRPSVPTPGGGCSARKDDFDLGERARLGIDLD